MLNREAQDLATFLATLALRVQAPDGAQVIARLMEELSRTESEWQTLYQRCGYVVGDSGGFNEANACGSDCGRVDEVIEESLGKDLSVQSVLSMLDDAGFEIVDALQGMRRLVDMTLDARCQSQFVFSTANSGGIFFLVCDRASNDRGREPILFGMDDVLEKGTVLFIRKKEKQSVKITVKPTTPVPTTPALVIRGPSGKFIKAIVVAEADPPVVITPPANAAPAAPKPTVKRRKAADKINS